MPGSSATTAASGVDGIVRQLQANGHCLFAGLIDANLVLSARAELARLLQSDLEFRQRHGIAAADHTHAGHTYSLTPHMHSMLFPAFRCEAAAGVIEAVIANDMVARVIERTVGSHYRLRVDLVRIASGVDDSVDDFQLPHEWHRDSPGEFTFGIFFDDMTAAFSGGTAVIDGGTHFLPYDPIWDFMFGSVSYTTRKNYLENHHVFVRPECRRLEIFNRMFKRELAGRFTEIRGRPGDAYLFLNDVWHGRAPNRQSRQFMTMRFGGFPTDFAFKDDLALPAGIDRLPPRLRAAYAADQPVNTAKDLLIHRARRARAPILARLAHLEKKMAIACTEAA